jgi:hypothetical protein
MAYCWKCGVELGKDAVQCVLCGTPVPGEQSSGTVSVTTQAVEEIRRIEETLEQPVQKRKTAIAAILVTVIFLIPALILLSVARVRQTDLGWALYPLFSLTVSWASVVILMTLFRHPRILTLVYAALAPSSLFVLDIIADGSIDWFWNWGVPVLAVLYVSIAAAAVVVLKFLKNRFFRTAAVLWTIALFLVALEAIIAIRTTGSVHLSWSLICSSALFPTGGFLVILSYLLRSNPDIRKMFRI